MNLSCFVIAYFHSLIGYIDFFCLGNIVQPTHNDPEEVSFLLKDW